MARIIQNKELPVNWIEKVEQFNTKHLNDVNKIIANRLINYIVVEKEKALQNSLVQSFVKHIFFGTNFLNGYENLPPKLVEDAIKELGGNKGYKFSSKLHSIFIEFITYKSLVDQGYVISCFKRSKGSCDLQMMKNKEDYHFEVKFKENKDIQLSRFFDFIDGQSMLSENGYLRGKTFNVSLLVENITDKNIDDIFSELRTFIATKKSSFKGKLLKVYQADKFINSNRSIENVTKIINDACIVTYDTEDLIYLICKIFVCNNGHLTKLIGKHDKLKSSNPSIRFHGVIAWTLPFNLEAKDENIEAAFRKVYEREEIEFPLHIFTGGIAKESSCFCISGSQLK